jgi:hypothetical protein
MDFLRNSIIEHKKCLCLVSKIVSWRQKKKEVVDMRLKNIGMLVFILCVGIIIIGCTQATSPVLKEIGPSTTKAGVDFNIQPDGVSAIWAKTANATESTVFMWGDTAIRTDYKGPELLTAPVPKNLYAQPGHYQIYLLEKKTGIKSNAVVFIVE